MRLLRTAAAVIHYRFFGSVVLTAGGPETTRRTVDMTTLMKEVTRTTIIDHMEEGLTRDKGVDRPDITTEGGILPELSTTAEGGILPSNGTLEMLLGQVITAEVETGHVVKLEPAIDVTKSDLLLVTAPRIL